MVFKKGVFTREEFLEMMRVVDQETETKKGVEALLIRIIESALFKSENNHVQGGLHKKI